MDANNDDKRISPVKENVDSKALDPGVLEVIAGSTNSISEKAVDANIVDFSGDDDPSNPMNRTSSVRWMHVGFVSFMAFVLALGDVAFAPAIPSLLKDFNVSTNSPLSAVVISIYSLGSIPGNMLGPPLSEWQGRLPILHTSNCLFITFIIACAVSPNIHVLCAFRFISAIFGSVAYTLGGPIIGDLFPQEKRGAAMAVFSSGQLIGPVVGPIFGGFLAQHKGWRWIFWLMAILAGSAFGPSLLLMRESYAPVVLERKVKALRISTGNKNLRSKFDMSDEHESAWTGFIQSLVRPAKMFFLLPMVTSISLYFAMIYGFLYIILTRMNLIYETVYHFSDGDIGLTYIGLGIGLLFGSIFCGVFSDWYMKKASAGGEQKPEYRLPPLLFGTVFIPLGFFLYGWSARFHLHWILPLIGTAFVGFGIMTTLIPSTNYLVDSFPLYAASAIAVTEILLAVSGATFPLAAPSLYRTLGLGWGNSLLGFLTLMFAPLPWILLRYGERIRKRGSSVKL
ncbi:multidrug resistance protein [Mollisia scopiformis]|uniref:Multidrug resistance protein n=1 Tax=Mollisia scopiformis TaxID=149040 RepID=A0A194WU73_MOLSC|nr:multidrug resistance protein [Mollisia scopiformis]KUJ11510.1 multidrug resistance protein [Mollisia scopiformis]